MREGRRGPHPPPTEAPPAEPNARGPHLVVHGVPPEGRLVLLTQHREHSQFASETRQQGAQLCGL